MAASTENSPLVQLPSEKTQKYDRQLRLWGERGQAALEASHACLINATTTGTELLKGIILPGVGAFTIVDANKISGEDAGNNFYLDHNSIGKPRAKVATELLSELNPDVRGQYVDESLEQLLETNRTFFDNFSIVIATGLTERLLLELSGLLWRNNVPLLIARTYGLVGYIRLQIREHTVIESHPDDALSDLRLDKPFSALVEYCDSIDMSTLNKKEHSHIPYVVIILKYVMEWQKSHDGSVPKTRVEKNEFKELIKTGLFKSETENEHEEENFEEALRAVNTALIPSQVPSSVQALFLDPSCVGLNTESSSFWIMVRALKRFVENEGNGLLPLRGSIPDMTADTENYVKLQNIYKNRGLTDAKTVFEEVQRLLQNLGKPLDCVSLADVQLFCKNSAFLRVIKSRSLAEEYSLRTAVTEELTMHLENGSDEIVFYLLLRAVDKFHALYDRYPGSSSNQVEPDIIKLKGCFQTILQDTGCSPIPKDDYIHEMCKFGFSELYSVAAFTAGCAAQEAIKVLTGQYVPINNTFIFNGITSTTATFQL